MPTPEQKALQLGILFVAAFGMFLGWRWSKRQDEAETSNAPDDVTRLGLAVKRVERVRTLARKSLPPTPWDVVVKRLSAIGRRSEQIDKRGM